MAGLFDTIGQVGQAVGGSILDSASGQQNQQHLLANIISRYKRAGVQSPNQDPNVPTVPMPNLTDPDPNRYDEPGAQGPVDPSQMNQQNWNQVQPKQSGGGGGIAALAGMAKGSTLVTQPTIAKIGEDGPEMVVPLRASAHNHVQPDLLEGHITQPKVPGVRYSRYKSFVGREY